jgi:hypothetical protein
VLPGLIASRSAIQPPAHIRLDNAELQPPPCEDDRRCLWLCLVATFAVGILQFDNWYLQGTQGASPVASNTCLSIVRSTDGISTLSSMAIAPEIGHPGNLPVEMVHDWISLAATRCQVAGQLWLLRRPSSGGRGGGALPMASCGHFGRNDLGLPWGCTADEGERS